MSRVVDRLTWIALTLALVAYYLPWVWHPGAGLSAGAYDLAEWLSLHPVARASMLPLFPSFVLRAAFALLAMGVAVHGNRATQRAVRWSARIAALALALTLFPPLEFLTVARDDANYQQQFALGMITFLVIVGLTLRRGRLSMRAERVIFVGLMLLGVVCSVWGLLEGQRGLAWLGVPVALGAGGILYVLSLGLVGMTNAALLRAGSARWVHQMEKRSGHW